MLKLVGKSWAVFRSVGFWMVTCCVSNGPLEQFHFIQTIVNLKNAVLFSLFSNLKQLKILSFFFTIIIMSTVNSLQCLHGTITEAYNQLNEKIQNVSVV